MIEPIFIITTLISIWLNIFQIILFKNQNFKTYILSLALPCMSDVMFTLISSYAMFHTLPQAYHDAIHQLKLSLLLSLLIIIFIVLLKFIAIWIALFIVLHILLQFSPSFSPSSSSLSSISQLVTMTLNLGAKKP